MTLVIDVGCPECGRKAAVRKVDLGEYRYGACDAAFSTEDVLPE